MPASRKPGGDGAPFRGSAVIGPPAAAADAAHEPEQEAGEWRRGGVESDESSWAPLPNETGPSSLVPRPSSLVPCPLVPFPHHPHPPQSQSPALGFLACLGSPGFWLSPLWFSPCASPSPPPMPLSFPSLPPLLVHTHTHTHTHTHARTHSSSSLFCRSILSILGQHNNLTTRPPSHPVPTRTPTTNDADNDASNPILSML